MDECAVEQGGAATGEGVEEETRAADRRAVEGCEARWDVTVEGSSDGVIEDLGEGLKESIHGHWRLGYGNVVADDGWDVRAMGTIGDDEEIFLDCRCLAIGGECDCAGVRIDVGDW